MLTIAREDNLRLSAPRQTFCRAGELLFRSSLTLWSGSQTVVLMLKALLLAPVLLFALSVCASAQTKPDPQDVKQSDPSQKSGEDMGPAAEEIMRRAEIRREEDSHKEMVERADEAAQIGDEILTAYKKKKSLSGDDLKKLESVSFPIPAFFEALHRLKPFFRRDVDGPYLQHYYARATRRRRRRPGQLRPCGSERDRHGQGRSLRTQARAPRL